MSRFSRLFRVIGLVAMLTMTVGPSVQAQSGAVGPVVTTAQVGSGGTGAGVGPTIECKWELPDMQPGVTDTTFPDGQIQYEISGGPFNAANASKRRHDDDVSAATGFPKSTDPTVPPACRQPVDGAGNPIGKPSMAGGFAAVGAPVPANTVHNMIQVKPNLHDEAFPGIPELRKIQLWAAVDHPGGISNIGDVYWKIFHPDGSFKTQVHGHPLATGPTGDCAKLGDSTTDGKMFNAAVETGQMSAKSVDDNNFGMIALCFQSIKRFYFSKFDLSKHQPYGEYRIELHAVSNDGTEGLVLHNYITVLPISNLEADFNTVLWTSVTPGQTTIVGGDLIFAPPNSGSPTVRNTGNTGITISVKFSALTQVGVSQGPKIIDQFDACFGLSFLRLECQNPIAAGVEFVFASENGTSATTALGLFGPTLGTLTNPPNGQDIAYAAGSVYDKALNNGVAGAGGSYTGNQTLCANRNGKLDLSVHPPAGTPAGSYTGTLQILSYSSKFCLTDNGHPDTATFTLSPNGESETVTAVTGTGIDLTLVAAGTTNTIP